MKRPRYFVPGELQFITASTYRRAVLFTSPRFCRVFVEVLEAVRSEFGFALLGWVLMPEHFHLLIWPQPAESTSRVVQQLKQRSAARILGILHENADQPWCRRMLAKLRLPPTVHDQPAFRVWQRRFYPFGVYSDKKQQEKLDDMLANSVERLWRTRPTYGPGQASGSITSAMHPSFEWTACPDGRPLPRPQT